MPWKAVVRYPVDIRRARQILRDKSGPSAEWFQRPIALVLHTKNLLVDGARHLAAIAHHANDAGSPLELCCDDRILAAIAHKPHGQTMLAMPGVIYRDRPSPGSLVLTDESEIGRTELQVGRDIDRSVPVMPYPMHPATLAELRTTSLDKLRDHPRPISMLFAGNQKPRYGDEQIGRGFNILNRLEVVETVRAHAGERVADRISDVTPSNVNHSDRIVLSDSRSESIEAADWLPALAGADFFLCCPGSSQPTCHHLTEAMAVGTIPILQYATRITPVLVDGFDAICFDGRSGLIDAIDRAAAMSPKDVAAMRDRVTAFYEEHLCGTRFMKRLRDGDLDSSQGRICLPFHDQNLYSNYKATRVA